MATELATATAVKALLEIPEEETAYDDAIDIAVSASNVRILNMIGFSLTAVSARVETFRKIFPGQILILQKRPVSAVSAVEARSYGSEWSTLTHDLIDAEQGMIVPIIPVSSSGSSVPPWERESWDNGSNWDLVRVTYDASEWTQPDRLVVSVANAFAVYLWHRYGAGASLSRQVGDLNERLLTLPMPDWVQDGLAEYVRGRVGLVA